MRLRNRIETLEGRSPPVDLLAALRIHKIIVDQNSDGRLSKRLEYISGRHFKVQRRIDEPEQDFIARAELAAEQANQSAGGIKQ